MSDTNIQETTSLKTRVIESSLEWNIENFKEYSKCDIGSITSRKISIDGTQASWVLSVHLNGYDSTAVYDDSYLSVSIQIKDKNPSENHSYKIEVKTNAHNHKNFEESDGLSHNGHVVPVTWNVEYENIGKEKHMEFYEEKFIRIHDLPAFMVGGTLRLVANVLMKSVEITDHVTEHPGIIDKFSHVLAKCLDFY